MFWNWSLHSLLALSASRGRRYKSSESEYESNSEDMEGEISDDIMFEEDIDKSKDKLDSKFRNDLPTGKKKTVDMDNLTIDEHRNIFKSWIGKMRRQ